MFSLHAATCGDATTIIIVHLVKKSWRKKGERHDSAVKGPTIQLPKQHRPADRLMDQRGGACLTMKVFVSVVS